MPNPPSPENGNGTTCAIVCLRIAEAEKHLMILSRQIRTLQFIVIGGMIVDFIVNGGHKVAAAMLGR